MPAAPEPGSASAEMAASFSQIHVPRLIGLGLLNAVGITALNQQDTLFFNLTDDATHTYSYRALVNSSPTDYAAALSAVDAPMLIVVGNNDEAFVADEYPAAVAAFSTAEVHLLPGENHNSIVSSAAAMEIISEWLSNTP